MEMKNSKRPLLDKDIRCPEMPNIERKIDSEGDLLMKNEN